MGEAAKMFVLVVLVAAFIFVLTLLYRAISERFRDLNEEQQGKKKAHIAWENPEKAKIHQEKTKTHQGKGGRPRPIAFPPDDPEPAPGPAPKVAPDPEPSYREVVFAEEPEQEEPEPAPEPAPKVDPDPEPRYREVVFAEEPDFKEPFGNSLGFHEADEDPVQDQSGFQEEEMDQPAPQKKSRDVEWKTGTEDDSMRF